jgi:transcriptional regulator of arginine metabolism
MFIREYGIFIPRRAVRDRASRLQAIKKIIRENHVSSQEDLLGHLGRYGFTVTQATLSRDLKLLKVGKISHGDKGYFYTIPSEEERRESERNFIMDFQRGYVSIDFSHTVGVVRTLTGHADSVAIALDNLMNDVVLGSVAGDDTVIIVLKADATPGNFFSLLRKKIPEFEE